LEASGKSSGRLLVGVAVEVAVGVWLAGGVCDGAGVDGLLGLDVSVSVAVSVAVAVSVFVSMAVAVAVAVAVLVVVVVTVSGGGFGTVQTIVIC